MNECLSIDSVDPCLFNECGVLCYHLKQYDKAEKALVTVLKLIDTYPVVWFKEYLFNNCRQRNNDGFLFILT